jgi:hypothetical protein
LRSFLLNEFLFTLGLSCGLLFLNRLLSSQISLSSCLISGQLRSFLLNQFLFALGLSCLLLFLNRLLSGQIKLSSRLLSG